MERKSRDPSLSALSRPGDTYCIYAIALPVCPPFAEYTTNFFKVVGKELAGKIEHEWFAQIELSLVWQRYVLLVLVQVFRELVFVRQRISKLACTQINLTCLPAHKPW